MLHKMAANPNNKPTVLCGLQYIIGTHDVLIGEHYTKEATTKESFKMLGWVDLETQRKAHKCILVFNCLNELVPLHSTAQR